MKFNFKSLFHFNDNIIDCSENIIEEIDYIEQVMIENLTQINQYRNYLNSIKTNINQYSMNQKLTNEELKKIIDMILEYNYC